MANQITLTNTSLSTSTSVRLLHGNLTYSWKNHTKMDSGEGYFGNVEAQFNGWENPAMTLQFYIPIDNTPSGTMTWALWNEFAKYQYDGVTQTLLSIKLGSSDTYFSDYSADSSNIGVTSIPIQIKSYTLNISPDTRDGYMWNISAQLQVTK